MTEIKTDYVSPYKFTRKSINDEMGLPSKMKAMKSSVNFRLKLENKKKYRTIVVPQNK